jgi:hypothetical protein
LLLEEYGYSNGMIDVIRILNESGIYDSDNEDSDDEDAYDRRVQRHHPGHLSVANNQASPERKQQLDSLEYSPPHHYGNRVR